MRKLTPFALAVFISTGAYATNSETPGSHSETLISGFKSTLDKEAAASLSEKEKSLAKQWMLTESDWVKYKQIMTGPRGIWSPGLDPITALGVSETDTQARKYYAELWIKMESRRAELEMAFEVERQRAASRILGNQLAVNNTSWIAEWEEKRVEINKQVLFFVEANCTEACKSKFNEVSAAIGHNARLEIYFKQGASSEDIGQWAAFMKIPPDVVRAKKIVLHFDEGKSTELGIDMSKLPQLRVIDRKSGAETATIK